MKLQRRDWAGLVFALVVAAVCVRLGAWQLDRLRQRRAWNAGALAAGERPPLGVTGGGLSPGAGRDRRRRAPGGVGYRAAGRWAGAGLLALSGGRPVDPLRPP